MTDRTEYVYKAANDEEYLRLEQRLDDRHELVDGMLFLMAGGTVRHNRIAGMLYAKLLEATGDGECEAFIENVKLRLLDGAFYYPDVMVVCDSSDRDPRYRTRPCFVAEVLSGSTAPIDRGEKLLNYRTISSLQTYVLLAQNTIRAEVYSKLPDGAWRYEVLEGDAMLEITCAGLSLPVSSLYKGVL